MLKDIRNPGVSDIPEEFIDLRFLDVEASGLHDGSYPIEIAWCGLDLRPVSMLIRPLDEWGEDLWDPEAEKIHGISLRRLAEEGLDAKECAKRLCFSLEGKKVLTDNPWWDVSWLSRLLDCTGTTAHFGVADLIHATEQQRLKHDISFQDFDKIVEGVRKYFPHTHRAGDDALGMAAIFRAFICPEWRNEVMAKM